MFKNRSEAAYLLVRKLSEYKHFDNVIVLTIPRGGVPIGRILADELHAPLDLVLSKKIGHPFHKEFAIGAVTMLDIILSPQAADVPKDYIERETAQIRRILKKRYQAYYGKHRPKPLAEKIVILVDDGVASGNTMMSCINLIKKQNPERIVVALPVAPPSTLQAIHELPAVDETICLHTPDDFFAVGQFYSDFSQVTDAEVVDLLRNTRTAVD